MASLLNKIRTIVGCGPPDRAAVRRSLELCARQGRPVSLQSARQEDAEEMIASIEQVREDDFIIDRPMVGALIRPLAIKEPLIVSFIGDSGRRSGRTRPLSRYRFTSGGKRDQRVLYGYRLEIPSELQANNRRQFHRISLERRAPIHATLESPDGAMTLSGQILDVSAGGMRLRLDKNAMIIDGQQLIMKTELPPDNSRITEPVRVQRVSKCPRTGQPIIGVSFLDEIVYLSRFVRQLDIQQSNRVKAVRSDTR